MRGRDCLPAFRRLGALEQLRLRREALPLLPRLLRLGAEPEDALALAYNAALLYRTMEAEPPFSSPEAVLERYSLGEIADLCETYRRVAAGELEYGEADDT